MYLLATNSDEHRGGGERKFQKKHESSNYFYSPHAIAKIPCSNFYFGKLTTHQGTTSACRAARCWWTGWWGNQQHSGKYHLWLPAPPSVSISVIRGKGQHTVPWLPAIPCRQAFQWAISSSGKKHTSNFTLQEPFLDNLHIITLALSLTQGWTCTLTVSWLQAWIMGEAGTSI